MAGAIPKLDWHKLRVLFHRQGPCNWRRAMSDNVAYALLVYTGLQIFMTVSALKGPGSSTLPYFGLAVLICAVIPGFRALERRWESLSDAAAANAALEDQYRKDRRLVWSLAIGLPFGLTLLLKVLDALL